MSSSLSHEVPWGAQGNLWPSPGKLMRRVLSEERGGCCSPRPGCGYSRATRRGTSHPLNCRRFQPSQSADPHQPAFALGSPVGVGIEGLAGEVESSCSHPREAMNLVHVRRISRRKPRRRRRKVYSRKVYFLINTCLTGLRSSEILSREVSVFIIIGLTARRGGEGRGKRRWRANTCALLFIQS